MGTDKIEGQRITAVVEDEAQDFDPGDLVSEIEGDGVDYGFINIQTRPQLGVAIQFLGGEASAKMIQHLFKGVSIIWKVELEYGKETFERLEIPNTGYSLSYTHAKPGDWLVSIHGTTRIEVFVDQEFRSLYRLREKFEPAELAIPFAIYKSFPEDGTRRTTSWLS